MPFTWVKVDGEGSFDVEWAYGGGQPRVIREENIERVYGVKIRINNDYNELGVPMKTITLLGTA